MFKKFSKIVFVIIFMGVMLVISSVSMITKLAWERYNKFFMEHTNKQMDFYLDNIVEDMRYAVESHAYWTDAIRHLNAGDEEWLSENVTTYIIDMGLFSTDYILIADESQNFIQESGGNIQNLLLSDEHVIKSLKKDTVNIFYKKINHKDALVISSPFMDNNLENPTGIYVSVSFLNDEKKEEIKNMFAGNLIDIHMEDGLVDIKKSEKNRKEIIIKKEILESGNYLVLTFNVDEMYKMFFVQRNHTFFIVFIEGVSIGALIIYMIYRIVSRLKQLTGEIEAISEGDYDYKVSFKNNECLNELNQLTSAVNKMSTDICEHLHTIDGNYIDMVDVIINAVKINDAYTSRHNIEVGKYAKIIAEEINYENVDHLILASKLHDIGKISVPSHILNKPGKLTDEEYEIIKIHPSKGYQIIEHLDYFSHIKLGVKYHHEHFDGSGYPEGLKGNDIPLIAQIISIADVYDAVTSDRSYRKGLSHVEAIKIIKEGSGTLFNPVLVDAFLRRIDDFNILMIENRAKR